MPKISVIIPVYGVEKYIRRCAESLFSQTLENIEFIFIDDCTPDKSMQILHDVIEKHRRHFIKKNWTARIEKMPRNSGLPAVRRFGIQISSGEYIMHCDSDDWVDKDIFRELYEKAKEDDADIVICDYFKVQNSELEHVRGCLTNNKDTFISDLLTENCSWSLWNKLIKTNIYRMSTIQYPEGNMGEDMALTLQLVLSAHRISYVPIPLYYYSYNPLSISHLKTTEAIFNKFLQFRGNADIVLSSFNRHGLNGRYDKELCYLKWCARRCLWIIIKQKSYRKAWNHTYPEIMPSILWSPYLKLKVKVKILLTYLNLYPLRKA